VTGGIFFCHIL